MTAVTSIIEEVRGFLTDLRHDWPDLFHPRLPPAPPPPPEGSLEALFHARASHWAPLLGVEFGRVRVKGQRSLWGSCTRRGDLNFNRRLLDAPREVLDYVVIHELAHRLEMNHSRRFWALVAQRCPSYRAWITWLRTYGPYLGI